MDAGRMSSPHRAVLPRSSACSKIKGVPSSNEIVMASKQSSTMELLLLTLSIFAPSSHGKPQGCIEDRNGLGPLSFAHGARDQVPQGGDMMTAS